VKRVVLITGVCGGVGRATAALFRSEGWTTVGIDRQKPSNLGFVDEFVQLDVSLPDLAGRIEALIDGLGTLDALVNNAAAQLEKPLVDTEATEWDEVAATNLRGPFLASKASAAALRARGGAIVNVSSVHAIATSAGVGAYAASKGGLAALTRSLALELAPEIRVNAVLPGAIDTRMLRAGVSRWAGTDMAAALDGLAQRTPLRRVGAPEDVAEAILYLADSGRSSFVTGQTLVVDGGVTAHLSSE
jgi:glucose 1-dehydrogenase